MMEINVAAWASLIGTVSKLKTKLRGLSPRANCTDQAIAGFLRSQCHLLIKGATRWAWLIPIVLHSFSLCFNHDIQNLSLRKRIFRSLYFKAWTRNSIESSVTLECLWRVLVSVIERLLFRWKWVEVSEEYIVSIESHILFTCVWFIEKTPSF
jgi:hypothetical protein